MKKIVHKPAAPLYAAAAVWVLYALLFPLYRVGHFVIVLAASAAVYGIARLFCKDVVEEVPEEPKTTGNPELDKMVSEGQKALDEMRRLNDSIQDAAISAQIDRLEQVSGKIFRQVQKDPTQLPQIRKFMSYYLPTTLKLLRAYDDMSHQGVQGENITGTMERVRGHDGHHRHCLRAAAGQPVRRPGPGYLHGYHGAGQHDGPGGPQRRPHSPDPGPVRRQRPPGRRHSIGALTFLMI